MTWENSYTRKYWETYIHSLSDVPLARIFRAIIQCEGRVHSSHCMEKKMNSSELSHANRYCGAHFIISLPVGAEEEFKKLSKCKLKVPKEVHVN